MNGRTRAMRVWDWAVPPKPLAHREVLSVLPEPDVGRPPLLFVHGIGHGAWCFAEHWLAAAAERGYPAHAVSLRGHGGSGGSKRLGRTLMRDYVHDILQTITELPSPPVLVGHSMGALLCQLVADRYPARGLVLLTPAPAHGVLGTMLAALPRHPGDVAAMVAGRSLPLHADTLFVGLDRESAERYVERTGRESPLAQYELLRRRRLGPQRAPVLVVGTPDDELIRVSDVERTAADYGVSPVWLPGMGHDVMLDAGWDRVLGTVLEFCADLPAWGTAPTR